MGVKVPAMITGQLIARGDFAPDGDTQPSDRRRWLRYLIGVPAFGLLYVIVTYSFWMVTFAIGDTKWGSQEDSHFLTVPLEVVSAVLAFPSMFPWDFLGVSGEATVLGEWLNGHLKLTDERAMELGLDGHMVLALAINAVFWGIAATWTVGFVSKRLHRCFASGHGLELADLLALGVVGPLGMIFLMGGLLVLVGLALFGAFSFLALIFVLGGLAVLAVFVAIRQSPIGPAGDTHLRRRNSP